MKLRFDVGKGDTNYGKTIFSLFIISIAVVAILFSYLVLSPQKRKVYLKQRAFDNSESTNSNEAIFDLYEISSLSEKELIALQQGYLDVTDVGVILYSYEDQSYKDVRSSIISNELEEDWELLEINI